VLNEGISGARVLRDRVGDNALARFDRDVLDQAHAETVVQMMGINDIGWPGTIPMPKGERAPWADDVIVGYQPLITRARTYGMRIVVATLTRHRHLGPLLGLETAERDVLEAFWRPVPADYAVRKYWRWRPPSQAIDAIRPAV
jgi:lysophospholipase L1-like esterase